jgi:general secretion pathway protein J
MRHAGKSASSGFTLIEALVALALMGIILGALATTTSQWLPNWNRGFSRVERSQSLTIGLDRLVADISAAEFIQPNRNSRAPLFVGNESDVTFVRTTLGPNVQPGLDIVHVGETESSSGRHIVRSRATFAPFATDQVSIDQLTFSDPVVLFRAPFRISFAYSGLDGVWKNSWQNLNLLPEAVRLTIRDTTNERNFSISTTAIVHVDAEAAIVCGNACAERAAPSDRRPIPEGQGSGG